MKKAFDTVHPDFIRIALQRMGLDDLHTDYYVRLNSAGRIIVRSPYAQHHLAKHGTRLLNHIDDHTRDGLTYFTAGRGIGQGDVTSATIWLLVFDVLLTALDLGSSCPTTKKKKKRPFTSGKSAKEISSPAFYQLAIELQFSWLKISGSLKLVVNLKGSKKLALEHY
jgi:hypothetical protein